jgi:hypothetical protein
MAEGDTARYRTFDWMSFRGYFMVAFDLPLWITPIFVFGLCWSSHGVMKDIS